MSVLPTLQEVEEYMMLRSLAIDRVGNPWPNEYGLTIWPFALAPNQHRLIYKCERQLFEKKERR
jgi:hypothetical protein